MIPQVFFFHHFGGVGRCKASKQFLGQLYLPDTVSSISNSAIWFSIMLPAKFFSFTDFLL